jgi:iron(III) transport system permease protein
MPLPLQVVLSKRGGAITALPLNTLKPRLSWIGALLAWCGQARPGTRLGLLIAYLLARTKFKGQGAFEFAALLAFAIPGTVLGVSYILAFNVPPFELTGTAFIIVLCFMFRNLPVGVRAGTAAFKQLDASLDEASIMLRASSWQTIRHVILPLLKPALVAALIYSFVRAITTVSAVIFLVTAENELATTYIIGRVGNGDYGVALAYCSVLIVLMGLATALIQWLVGERKLGRRKVRPSAAPKLVSTQGMQ